jgi:hypothetical protein
MISIVVMMFPLVDQVCILNCVLARVKRVQALTSAVHGANYRRQLHIVSVHVPEYSLIQCQLGCQACLYYCAGGQFSEL